MYDPYYYEVSLLYYALCGGEERRHGTANECHPQLFSSPEISKIFENLEFVSDTGFILNFLTGDPRFGGFPISYSLSSLHSSTQTSGLCVVVCHA